MPKSRWLGEVVAVVEKEKEEDMEAVEKRGELLETRMYKSRATERRMMRRRTEDARAWRRRVDKFAGILEFR